MSAKSYDPQPIQPLIQDRAEMRDTKIETQPGDYEPPSLMPAGNLRDLLGKSGILADYRHRRPNAKRP